MTNTTTHTKHFIIQRSELDNHLSPLFYKSNPIHLDINESLNNIASINPYRQKPKFDDDELVPYVGLPETDEHTRSVNEVIMRPYREVKGRNIIYPNDILFARIEPSIFNKKYIFADDLLGFDFAFTSTEFYIIEEKSVDIKYLFALLFSDYVYNQISGKTTGSTGRRRLDIESFKNIQIPVINDQQKIVSLYQTAYNTKKQKEQEAQALLNRIDTYLLDELGITLPAKDNSLKSRMFTVNFSEVSGDRLDPDYNLLFYTQFLNSLDNKYFVKSLSEIKKSIFQGVSKNITDNPEYTLLKVKNILRGNQIDYSDVEYVSSVPKTKILQNGDIISPFIGEAIRQNKFSLFQQKNLKYTVDNNTGVIRLSDNINKLYVSEVLNSLIGEFQVMRLIGGGGVPYLGSEYAGKVLIPLPPIDKQTEIANHISDLRIRAKQLQEEATDILNQAKATIENMILT
ncbi:MAG: restriction endonuclease subunit S [Lewinellaceae bacterium]|nr:restriction endonuclease subunit S [Lewinellaceae bacterium]